MNEDFLMHYGVGADDNPPGRGSGRYPKGSGDNPYQRYGDFLSRYKALQQQGMSNKDMAAELGMYDRFGNPSVKAMKARYSNCITAERAANQARARQLADEGYSPTEIAKMMGAKNESTVRSWLDESRVQRVTLTQDTADVLKEYVDKHRYIDIDSGTEIALGVTKNRLSNAVALLKDQGYNDEILTMDRLGSNHKMHVRVLTPPDCTYQELSEHRYDVVGLMDKGRVMDINGEISKLGVEHPASIDSSRIYVRYAEDGGKDKDGLIELRRGVEDISLEKGTYAQVRIAVDDSHYMKGMAMYSDDIPPGYDIVYNSKKHVGADFDDVFKKMKKLKENGEETDKVDWDNPFGASIEQKRYLGSDGKEHLSALNIVQKHEEGDWQEWNKNLASQFLSKQPVALAERQLKLASADKQQEFMDICNLTNNTIKKEFLIDFADKCDAAAVELKAAPFPGQQTHVLLPFPQLKDNEIYAPNYEDGTNVALVRYPHGGIFEIPVLTVRNTGSPVKDILGNTPDAVGINLHTAEILSGADFDGDTAIVIPLSDKVRVRNKKPLEELKDFDHIEQYAGYPGMEVISAQNKQTEMGKVTNLIMDMTLKGASDAEIAKAVKHSMVIIDAEKHKLDYKRSYAENDIATLKKRWQSDGEGHEGAGTIISRAKSKYMVEQRKDWSPSTKSIDPVTGEKKYTPSEETYFTGQLKLKPASELHTAKDGRTYYMVGRKRVYGTQADMDIYNKQFKGISFQSDGSINVEKDSRTGEYYYLKKDPVTRKSIRVPVTEDDFSTGIKEKPRLQASTKMAEAKDAFELTSGGSRENYGYRMEKVYAEYANQMKALGNAARLEWLNTPNLEYDKQAAVKYKEQVDSLNKKLNIAKLNAPLERQAQRIGNQVMAVKKMDNPDMSKEELKRYKAQAIDAARKKTGAHKQQIEIDDKEWEAIQAGAISHSKLSEIVTHSNLDVLRQKATPRATQAVSPSMKALAKSMNATGYTTAQIAERLGISQSSVYRIVSDKESGD